MREYRPRVVSAAGVAGVHAAARHPLWRISPERAAPTDADDPERGSVASAAEFLRQTVADRPTIGRDAGPARVAERWRTAEGTTYHVAGRTAADAARLGDRLRDAYGETAVAAVAPTDAFPPVGADDHVACAEFRLRRHRFHPLSAAAKAPNPYDLPERAVDRPAATDGGTPTPVRSVVQAVFRPRSESWTDCGLVTSNWRDLLLRARGVDDLPSFARRIAARRAAGGVRGEAGDDRRHRVRVGVPRPDRTGVGPPVAGRPGGDAPGRGRSVVGRRQRRPPADRTRPRRAVPAPRLSRARTPPAKPDRRPRRFRAVRHEFCPATSLYRRPAFVHA